LIKVLKTALLGTMDATPAWLKMVKLEGVQECIAPKKKNHIARKRF